MRAALLVAALTILAGCGRQTPAPETGGGPAAIIRLQPSGADGPAIEAGLESDRAQVQFRLAGLDQPASELTAELERVGGDQIRRWPVVEAPPDADGIAHAVVVPIYDAGPGEYILTVWAGDVEVVRRYRFRVTATTP